MVHNACLLSGAISSEVVVHLDDRQEMDDNQFLITTFINSLSLLKPHQLSDDDFCPICFIPFTDLLDEQPTTSEESIIGVTKLESCGHVFCMKEHKFLDIRTPSDSDDESSDGGEYLPNPDEDEDEESLYNYDIDTDPLTDADMEVEEMDLDVYNAWEREMDALEEDIDIDTDGDSSVIHSEEAFGDIPQTNDGSISIHEDEELEQGIVDSSHDDAEQK
ncbi:hypothetical protein V5O48_004274 [Marasmius crinis-equi]|uniref:Uncharacterized protein n=1 Tax=Marasmius crinis-equi TaxID=585013 RepID=A0ABR3FQJ9_9AGAR